MVRTKDEGGIKSNLIVMEVQKRPCLFDSNHPHYGDRAEKFRCWEEVCENVVPGWGALETAHKFAAAKEVQKRWRSIRDSYTKSYRQGKCMPAEQCTPGSRRYHYHQQMAFLLRALQNKKPRYSQDKYESFSEVSNSPQHSPPEEIPKIKTEILDKPLDLKTRPDVPKPEPQWPEKPEAEMPKPETHMPKPETQMSKPETQDKCNQINIDKEKNSLEIKIDANSILPDDHFDDDKLFMSSLIPLFKKMDDDTRLLCRIEVLKIIRYALQGHKNFEALKMAEDRFFKNRMSGILANEERVIATKTESRLSMTTRSADGSRPIRKRRDRSPTPPQVQPKRRGPGRPRKVRPPPSDSDEDFRGRSRKLPSARPVTPWEGEHEDSLSRATSVAHLPTNLFMKMYNLGRSKDAPLLTSTPQSTPVQIKTEPMEPEGNIS